MITLYSGTPGSGKSYHAACRIDWYIRYGGSLICNFPVSIPAGRMPKSELLLSYWDNSDITPDRLYAYARLHHKVGLEGQTLLIVDEAQVIWNCRDFATRDRRSWITFFAQHRKLGYDVLLITQNDRMLDRQIRMLIEYEVKHRKINNYGFGGKVLSLVTGRSTWFLAMEYWYGGNKVMLNREMIRYKASIADLYNSYELFDTGSPAKCEKNEVQIELDVKNDIKKIPPKGGELLVPFVRKQCDMGSDDKNNQLIPPPKEAPQGRSAAPAAPSQ